MAERLDLKSEKEKRNYVENIGAEYRHGCFTEKDPESCHQLADYLEHFKNDLSKAYSVHRSNCEDYKHGLSCMKAANYSFLGKGVPKDLMKSFNLYTKACEYGETQSCLNSGLMCISNSKDVQDIPKDYEKGMRFLSKACDQENAYSCFYLSGLYIEGINNVLSKDMEKAFKYGTRACDYGSIYACANLSQMYKNGEGIEKDVTKAEELRTRTNKLIESAKKGFPMEK